MQGSITFHLTEHYLKTASKFHSLTDRNLNELMSLSVITHY